MREYSRDVIHGFESRRAGRYVRDVVPTRQPTPADPLYLVLGRFAVEFSQFVGHMEAGLRSVAAIGRGTAGMRTLQVVTAELAADQLRNIFFAVCTALTELDPDEQTIRDKLNGRARKLIETRNQVFHAVWFPASTTGLEEGGVETRWDTPLGVYQRVSHKETLGIARRDLRFEIAELDALADEAAEMRRLIWAFSSGCAERDPDWPGVAQRLGFVEGTLVCRDPILPKPSSE